jgi:hypothetical protein
MDTRFWYRLASLVVLSFALAACSGAPPADGTPPPNGTTPPVDGTGCPATSGFTLSGAVRLATLHPTPRVTGPSVIVKFPCGRELDDPAKGTCGQGSILVWLCTTPDCSATSDPVRWHRNADGSLVQPSFDKEPFEFCGLTDGTYYVLPIVDHDDSGSLTNFDWTMGQKNLAAAATPWPARPLGHEVEVTGDVALGTSVVPTSPDVSPVVVDFFHYVHPTPERQSEDAWLFAVASLDPRRHRHRCRCSRDRPQRWHRARLHPRYSRHRRALPRAARGRPLRRRPPTARVP